MTRITKMKRQTYVKDTPNANKSILPINNLPLEQQLETVPEQPVKKHRFKKTTTTEVFKYINTSLMLVKILKWIRSNWLL
jgi:hypothetical protein